MNKRRNIKQSIVVLCAFGIWYGLMKWLWSLHKPFADILGVTLAVGMLVLCVSLFVALSQRHPEERLRLRVMWTVAVVLFVLFLVWAFGAPLIRQL